MKQQARAIVVVGMHRSGTSALARALQTLGVTIGDRADGNEWNPRGYFEHPGIVHLDDCLLSAIGKRWDSLALPSWEDWAPVIEQYRDEALALLERDFGDAPIFGFKDPRASRLLPFWKSLFERSGIEDGYVICLRHPTSVARSLATRNGMTGEKSYLLWLLHMFHALEDTADKPRAVVDYDSLIAEPGKQLERLAGALRLPITADVERAIDQFINGFLSKSLRHSTHDAAALRNDPRAGELVRRMFDLQHFLARSISLGNDEARLVAEEVAAMRASLRDNAPIIRYLDTCQTRIDALDLKPASATRTTEGSLRSLSPQRGIRSRSGSRADTVAMATAPASKPAPSASTARSQPAQSPLCVSVVIPLHNHERYIEEAINSVLAQTVAPSEIIVIDDGSSDRSAEIVKRICASRPEIIFWTWPNQGAHHTLNAGIRRATGDYIAILNSDDRFHPDRLAECLAAVQSDPAIDVVATEVELFGDELSDDVRRWYEDALAFYRSSDDLPLALCHANFLVSTSNLFVRRSLFESIGYFAPLRYTHDLEFFLRLVLERKHFRFLARPLLNYRLHGQNTISESTARADVERAAVLAFFIYRESLAKPRQKERSRGLRRYVEVLGRQDLLDNVEYFLAALTDSRRGAKAAQSTPLATELTAFLSRLGISAVAAGAPSAMLDELVKARNDFLRRTSNASAHQVEIDRLNGILTAKDQAIASQRAEIHRLLDAVSEKEQALQTQGVEIARLNHALTLKDSADAARAAEVARLNEVVEEKTAALSSQGADIHRLYRVLAEKEVALSAQADRIGELLRTIDETASTHADKVRQIEAIVADKECGLAIQSAEIDRLNAVVAEKSDAVEKQRAEIHRMEQAVADKEFALHAQASEINRLYEAVADKERALHAQAGEIGRLNDAVTDKDCALHAQAGEIGRLHDAVTDKERALHAQAGEIGRLNDAVTDKERALHAQAGEIGRLHDAVTNKERALHAQAGEIGRLNDAVARKLEALAAQSADVARLQDMLDATEAQLTKQSLHVAGLSEQLLASEDLTSSQAADLHRLATELQARTEEILRVRDALLSKERQADTQTLEIARVRDRLRAEERAGIGRMQEIEARSHEIVRLNEQFAAKHDAVVAQHRHILDLMATLDAQGKAVAELKAYQAHVAAIAAEKEHELARLRETGWYKLGTAFDGKWSLRKLGKVAYYSGAWLTPESLKPHLRPMALKLRGAPPSRHAPASDATRRDTTLERTTQSRQRVLHVIANFMLGGSSRLVMDLVERLGDGYEHKVLTSFIPTKPAYSGVDVIEFRSPQSPEDIRAFLADYDPSLVHVHYWGDCDRWWYDILFKAIAPLGCRVIENINTPVEPYEADCVNRYVYVSHYVHEHFGNGSPLDMTIYPGSDFSLFSRSNGARLPHDCIGMVYRLESDKLNPQSIDAFVKVVQRRPQTRVVIVGGGTYLEPYRQAVDAAGVAANFDFTGYVDYHELPRQYERITAFIAPVWKESFGQVSPFAMSMGIPVLGYNVGGLAEIVGDPSLLAPPGDSDALASLAINVLDNPDRCESIGARNRDRARELYSVEAMIGAYRSVYAEVLGIAA